MCAASGQPTANNAVSLTSVQVKKSRTHGPTVAVGVNTGSGVQAKRIPPVLSTWMSTTHAAGFDIDFLILSDVADKRLRITAVPPPYFCSASPTVAQFYGRPKSIYGTADAHKYFSDWGWLKPGLPAKVTPAAVAAR